MQRLPGKAGQRARGAHLLGRPHQSAGGRKGELTGLRRKRIWLTLVCGGPWPGSRARPGAARRLGVPGLTFAKRLALGGPF